MEYITVIGLGASTLTATSLIPQTLKLIREKKADDVSLVMLSVLLGGLGLWIYYGVLKEDLIILLSNALAVIVNVVTFTLAVIYKRNQTGASEPSNGL